MDYVLLLCLSLALLVAVIVVLRERRLRLALQRLVFRLLRLWRPDDPEQNPENRDPPADPGGGGL